MLSVSHFFAHPQTMEKAVHWLAQLGFDSSRVFVRTQGIPHISVLVDASEFHKVDMILNAAELTDPDGWPGVYDLAHQTHVYSQPAIEGTAGLDQARTTVIGWHPTDRSEKAENPYNDLWDVMTRYA